MNDTLPRGTRAHMPDLDWSQIRETVLMLELCAGQIEGAMTDSNRSVEVLTGSFTAMADSMAAISGTLERLPNAGPAAEAKGELQAVAQNVSGMVHQAIIAFQFYDKLVQRLAHVTHGLGELSALVSDNARLYNPTQWRTLQEQIRSRYTMREEQAMFDAVMNGMPVKEAIEHFMAEMHQKSGDDIELF